MFVNNQQLRKAIILYCSNKQVCIETYGEPNNWDVSKITDMSRMFLHNVFEGDISKWNVSNVTNMSLMFYDGQFCGDISEWDVSNVTDMNSMFSNNMFNGDLSKWDVSNVTNMNSMFTHSYFNGDISSWDVSSVTDMAWIFTGSKFNGDISNWDIGSLIYGKEDIIKMGVKLPEIKKVIQPIEEGYEECPVTCELIHGDYLRCLTCKHCFDIKVEKWIDENKCCPYCRSKWKKKIIYCQFRMRSYKSVLMAYKK